MLFICCLYFLLSSFLVYLKKHRKDLILRFFRSTNFKQNFPEKSDEIEILKQVLLITPENIHLNSFMYEPILDTDICELKNLYQEIKTLNHATTN